MPPRLKILHVITGLGPGGAQSGLVELIRQTPELEHRVATLSTAEPYGQRLAALGVPVFRTSMETPLGLPQLLKRVRDFDPDWLHSWLYHADLLTGLIGRATRRRVLWHLHVSNLEPTGVKARTRWIARRCADLSSILPEHIVACSYASHDVHAALGYHRPKLQVIENGVDVNRFQREPSAAARDRLAITPGQRTIGMVARFDPQKDVNTCLEAFAQLRSELNASLLLIGEGMSEKNRELRSMIEKLGISSSVRCLGPQMEMERVYPALDVFTLSSVSEGLSMSLLEAMSCEVVPVVTRAGDATHAVGDTGYVVPIKDATALAHGLRAALTLSSAERRRRGEAARQRVVARYSAARQAARFRELYGRTSSTGARRE